MKILHTNIKIPSLSGKKTLARVDWDYVDSDFENYGTDKKGAKTQEIELAVLEMDKDGTFKKIFDSINKNTDSMILSQEQIIHFCENNKYKLQQEGWANFFLFKVDNEFFVADVFVRDDGRLRVFVYRFSHGGVWSGEFRHRIVVPQLALKNYEPSTFNTLPLESAIERVKKEGYVIYKPI